MMSKLELRQEFKNGPFVAYLDGVILPNQVSTVIRSCYDDAARADIEFLVDGKDVSVVSWQNDNE